MSLLNVSSLEKFPAISLHKQEIPTQNDIMEDAWLKLEQCQCIFTETLSSIMEKRIPFSQKRESSSVQNGLSQVWLKL